MEVYAKPHNSLAQQLTLLKSRGLLVASDEEATQCLRRNGYYRLSAYWYPFREIANYERTDTFLPNSRFEDARELYVFDKKFKLLLLDAVERVEIATRAEIALCLGERDIFAHTNAAFFRPSFTEEDADGDSKHKMWLRKIDSAFSNASAEFARHHKSKYGENALLPI